MYEIRQILVRMRQGDSDRKLSRAGVAGRRKAAAVRALAVEHNWLDATTVLPDDAALARIVGAGVDESGPASRVEPWRTQVTDWASQGVSAKQIYRALCRNHQFTGSYSAVYRFVRQIRATSPDVTMHLTFAPGEAAQVDFGTGPLLTDPDTGTTRKTWFFLMTLCYSRHQYAELVYDQKVETWLACHQHAFEWFGGVATRITIDNPRCAITTACRRDPLVQRSYSELAEAYGFLIDPCPPRDPQKKGRVESGINYLKKAFVPLRDFSRGRTDANHQLLTWISEEAGNRTHGTTGDQPLARFAIEHPLLKPLPVRRPVIGTWTQVKVHRDSHVQYQKCLYSAPFRLVGKALWLHASDASVRIYDQYELVAVHTRLLGPAGRSTQDDHLPPEAIAWKQQDVQWCLRQARDIGTHCHQLVDVLFADKVLYNLRAVQGVIRLKQKVGSARLEAACRRALHYNNPRYHTVKKILDKGLDQLPNEQLAFDVLAESYTGKGRFCRNPNRLLKH